MSRPLTVATPTDRPLPGLAVLAPTDVPELKVFLLRAGLTSSGLGDPAVRMWLLRTPEGQLQACAGYELSDDGEHALIRSVAVDASRRREGLGHRLAEEVLDRAVQEGARRAWLFSRRGGSFWERLGFRPADRAALTGVFARTHQVRHFQCIGLMHEEVAWWRSLLGAHRSCIQLPGATSGPLDHGSLDPFTRSSAPT